MPNVDHSEFEVRGQNRTALFSLKIHRGEGMCLLAMNWKNGTPPDDFVGFAIEYREPDGDRFFQLKNRLSFVGSTTNSSLSTRLSPIQKFRWVHFPRNADIPGKFTYRVTPVFMNELDELSYGEFQEADIALMRETYPSQLNVTFTRGFVSSQAFVDFYDSAGPISTLLPAKADEGLTFTPTHPKTKEALAWMGFEARTEILDVLDKAIADVTAKVLVVAYDLNEPEMVTRLEKLKTRLRIIIDDDGAHGEAGSGENMAEDRLVITAGREQVKRQHMGKLQHNKMIVVDGDNVKAAIGGSTNFSWRGFYVQANNAVVLSGAAAIEPFKKAFEQYWLSSVSSQFGATQSAEWNDLGLTNINAKVTFSPHSAGNAVLASIASDINDHVTSSLFFSLAFLYQTQGPVRAAVTKVTADPDMFVYGISDKRVGGMDLLKPDGNRAPVFPSALRKNVPEPFKSEVTGGGGTRMHHKFVVIDFDKPTARVYLGSYNFSGAADNTNGENLLLIKDRKIAVSYTIEALRIFDHYHFRVAQNEAKEARKKLELAKPPRAAGELPWWAEDYSDVRKVKDRVLFSK
ncbi:phospholipase D-like domain-containing protein [Dyadobacter pollutisoli]|uniref:phospholipase D n=1 Tax=Dyadobacter pollutisoli TaxID=2910158 RepID=A0A9E8SNQ5_9BACT|nr:phospholipase D-like domain-containing protein [Dyadobacter pollutisoli]WAC14624.1 phospholipase D-like domain-containing protein [Dyadobacter pollutisoli]